MLPLLIIGPDSTLSDTYSLAKEIWPDRLIEQLVIPSVEYYKFDLSRLSSYSAAEWSISLSVNEFYINDVRRALRDEVAMLGFEFTSLISPRAQVSDSARIGCNTIIHAGCFVGSNSTIGDFCVLRHNVVVSEDVHVKDYVTLEANVAIRELSRIGSFVTVCANSSLLRGAQVGDHCYLNILKQYSGKILTGTFFSPAFPTPGRIFGLRNQDF